MKKPFDQQLRDLMNKRPGKVDRVMPIRRRFCVDKDRAALAYAIWLNCELRNPDTELIREQRLELIAMNNRDYARELSNTMAKGLREANRVSRELKGRPISEASPQEWERVREKMWEGKKF